MAKHILVGVLVGVLVGAPYEFVGGQHAWAITAVAALVGMFASAWIEDQRGIE